ncbi:hypothetical protein JCM3766R1_005393 [Sporobolomyces carnicolor]
MSRHSERHSGIMPDPEEADLGMARPIVLSPTELAGLHRHAKRIEQEDLEVEAAVRRVHLYADSVCEVALRKAEGNRRDDEQKLKRWKDELFAVVGPSDGSNFWFVQEHGTSAFLRIAAVLNPMRERAENMIVPIYESSGLSGLFRKKPTGERKIGQDFTVDWIIENADLGDHAHELLGAYRERHPISAPQHSLAKGRFRISSRVAQLHRKQTFGPACQGGLLSP